MSLIRSISFLTVVIILLVSMCTIDPTSVNSPGTADEHYSFAAERLEQYLIYQDRLPSDLYAFSCPESLYSSVKDRYTIYYNVENARSFRKSYTTSSSGFGIRFNIDPTNQGFLIKNVFEGSPAASAGLRDLDTLVAVNGLDCTGLSYDSLKVLLASIKTGIPTVLKVRRSGGLFEFTLSKGEYLAPTVFADSLNSTTMHIAITSFLASTNTEGGTAVEFLSALNRFPKAQNIILDLRGNGGGFITQCVDVASHFVPKGDTLVKVTYRAYVQSINSYQNQNDSYLANGTPDLLNKNIYILCDSNTASASEIVIAGLKSSRPEIKLVGTVTFGKGIGQSVFLGPDSVEAKVTSMIIVRRNGISYHGTGIVPDVLTSSKDALNKTLGIINGSILGKKHCIPESDSPDKSLVEPINDVLIKETELR